MRKLMKRKIRRREPSLRQIVDEMTTRFKEPRKVTLPFPIPTAADLMDGPSDTAVASGWIYGGKAPR